MVQDLFAPPYGYSWQPAADPTGNGLQSSELVHRAEDGTITRSRFFSQVLNTAGLRFVDLSSGESSGAFFRDANGKLVIA